MVFRDLNLLPTNSHVGNNDRLSQAGWLSMWCFHWAIWIANLDFDKMRLRVSAFVRLVLHKKVAFAEGTFFWAKMHRKRSFSCCMVMVLRDVNLCPPGVKNGPWCYFLTIGRAHRVGNWKRSLLSALQWRSVSGYLFSWDFCEALELDTRQVDHCFTRWSLAVKMNLTMFSNTEFCLAIFFVGVMYSSWANRRENHCFTRRSPVMKINSTMQADAIRRGWSMRV